MDFADEDEATLLNEEVLQESAQPSRSQEHFEVIWSSWFASGGAQLQT